MDSLTLGCKTCGRCGTTQPLSEFSKRNDTASGYVSHCKACVREKSKAHYRKAADSPRVAVPAKFCTSCQQAKPASEFSPRKDHDTGYHAHCKACRRATRAANPEPSRQKALAYYYAHADERKAKVRAYQKANRDKVNGWAAGNRTRHRDKRRTEARTYMAQKRAADPDAAKARDHAYRVANRGKSRQRALRYYAQKITNGGNFTGQEWSDLKARYGHCCLACGRHESIAPLSPDHVIPVSRGGPNTIANIQPLCLRDNQRKGSRIIDYR